MTTFLRGLKGWVLTDEGRRPIMDSDMDDLRAWLRANDVDPNRILVGTTIDARHGELVTPYVVHDPTGHVVVEYGRVCEDTLTLPLKVPYFQGGKP